MTVNTAPPLAVRAEGLTKRYGKSTVLDGIGLEVPAGTVAALLGPNGAGKTTLVRILTTLLRPDAGRAEVAGFDVSGQPARVRSAIGLVGQHAAVDEILSGRQNLVMFGRLQGLRPRAARRRAGELLALFELEDAADRAARQYSGGMRRRLDLAVSLIAVPAVLFLDEPTTGLDPVSRAAVWQSVRTLAGEGTAVLLTTQYLDEADQLASQITVLDAGRVIAHGTPGDLKSALGADRVQVTLTDAADLPELTAILDRAGIGVEDVTLRRPTLDEVFLRLVGRPA